MRALRVVPMVSFALCLASCEPPPTAVDDTPQLGATHLTDPSEWEMVQDWTLWEGPWDIACGNGGAGATFWWSQEIAAWGKMHVAPSGNFIEIAKVQFRNVQLRLGGPDGELYPYVRVVQPNIIHQYQQDGRTVLHMTDNEFYRSPDGRNLRVGIIWQWVMGGDGKPAELLKQQVNCSPGRW